MKTFHWGSWRLARCIGIACCVLQSVQGAVIMKRKRVEVEAVAAPTAAISPCVCYFPNGVPPPESTATTSSSGHAEDIEFSMYSKPTGKVSTQNVLVGSRVSAVMLGWAAWRQGCGHAARSWAGTPCQAQPTMLPAGSLGRASNTSYTSK